jgi:LmbE family N-acetylglucosaminyl deacetylase
VIVMLPSIVITAWSRARSFVFAYRHGQGPGLPAAPTRTTVPIAATTATVATILAFHAHPDDEVLLTGGTLARLAAGGHQVIIVYDPQGGYGHPDHVKVHRVGALAAQMTGTRILEATLPRRTPAARQRSSEGTFSRLP